jgi:hypothetical protein
LLKARALVKVSVLPKRRTAVKTNYRCQGEVWKSGRLQLILARLSRQISVDRFREEQK